MHCCGREVSDTDYRTVEVFENLTVGMPFRGGAIMEIYHGLDKFTVSVNREGGTEIKHCKISDDRLWAAEAS